MKNLDHLMDKQFNRQNYNCAHFAAEVWQAEMGENILPVLTPTSALEKIPKELLAIFKRHPGLPAPSTLALAVMRTPGEPLHLGVYRRGRILHLHERGVENLPPNIASLGFFEVLYYVRSY